MHELSFTRPLRVVVVDDSRFARRVLIHVLSQSPDIEVIGEAADGEEALAQIARLHPDAVTLDLDMPGLNGFEVLRRLRPANMVPVVLVTALPDLVVGAERAVAELHVAGIVTKTFSDNPLDLSVFGDELATRLREAVDSPSRHMTS